MGRVPPRRRRRARSPPGTTPTTTNSSGTPAPAATCGARAHRSTSAKDGALSTLECDARDGGPQSATFWLYSDQGALDEAFNKVTSNATLETCPDGTKSPGKWHYTKNPSQTAGQLACGTETDGAIVVWTEDSKDFVAAIHGPDLKNLFTWWQKES